MKNQIKHKPVTFRPDDDVAKSLDRIDNGGKNRIINGAVRWYLDTPAGRTLVEVWSKDKVKEIGKHESS